MDKTRDHTEVPGIADLLSNFRRQHREDLIPCMQMVQDTNGYMSEEAIAAIGEYFGIPATKVYGIATFYDYFSFSPVLGETVRICNGTSCHMQGSGKVSREAEKVSQLLAQKQRLKIVVKNCECQGACNAGPIMQVNQQIFTNVDAKSVKQFILQGLGKGEHHD